MEEKIIFKKIIQEDDDYATYYSFESDGSDLVIKELWVDSIDEQKSAIWIVSNDGQKICIPYNHRRLVAKLIREVNFK